MISTLPYVLIVDDEPSVREYLSEALSTCCARVTAVENLHSALQVFEKDPSDILLADICMPGGTGLDLLAVAQQLNWDCAVILMTGHAELEHLVAGVRLHAADLLLKPFSIDTLQHSVQKSFEKLQAARHRRSEHDILSAGLRERTEQLRLTQHLLNSSYRSSLETLVATLEAREHETYAHSFRVREYALHLATVMNHPAHLLPLLAHAALLHDVGKVAVCDAILLKPGPLTLAEFHHLKSHSAVGERIVNRMGFLSGAGKIVRHHHERWDGEGYPDGIAGEEIPMGSRFFAVADTLDAMTSNRCYRKAMTFGETRAEISRCAGTQFDPQIVEAFDSVAEETWQMLRNRADNYARAATIPELNLGGSPFCAPAPNEFLPLVV